MLSGYPISSCAESWLSGMSHLVGVQLQEHGERAAGVSPRRCRSSTLQEAWWRLAILSKYRLSVHTQVGPGRCTPHTAHSGTHGARWQLAASTRTQWTTTSVASAPRLPPPCAAHHASLPTLTPSCNACASLYVSSTRAPCPKISSNGHDGAEIRRF